MEEPQPPPNHESKSNRTKRTGRPRLYETPEARREARIAQKRESYQRHKLENRAKARIRWARNSETRKKHRGEMDYASPADYESLKNDNAGSMPPQAPTFRAAPESSQNARQSQQQYEYPEPNSSSNSVPTSGPSAFTSKFQIQTASGSNDMAIDPALQALEGGANSLPTITMNGELLDFAIRMEGMPQQQTEADKAQDGQPNQHPDAGPLPQNPWEGQEPPYRLRRVSARRS